MSTVAAEYATNHGDAYFLWINRDIDRMSRIFWILQIAFLLFTLNNYLKLGPTAWWFHIPSMVILFAYRLLVPLLDKIFPNIRIFTWDFFVGISVFSSVFLTRDGIRIIGVSHNAPILVATLFCCMVGFHKLYYRTILRNSAVVALALLLLFNLDPVHAPSLVIQFVSGYGGAVFLGYYSHQARMLRFYVEETNQKQRYFAFQELAKVVPPHVVKHIESGSPLETSMPTGFGSACVLSFDIIGSSSIKSLDFPAAMDRFMAKAYNVMMENYNDQTLSANAYRIKDTGDGFLCSIGYPYQPPTGRSSCELAVELALRIVELFKTGMDRLHYHAPIACAVGISHGTVEAFFPTAGVKQYDLRGHPLTLATRYESIRKVLIAEAKEISSYLIIQEAVYRNLSRADQDQFQHYDATLPGHSIRDDADAKIAYYQKLAFSPAYSNQTKVG